MHDAPKDTVASHLPDDLPLREQLLAAIGPAHTACVGPVIAHLLPLYERNEAEAQAWQKRFNLTAVVIYMCAAAAVTVSIALYIAQHLNLVSPSAYRAFGAIEIGLMMLALGLIMVSRRGKWQSRWLHARHLAERLRVAMFVTLIPDFVRPLPDPAEMQRHYHFSTPELLKTASGALAHPDLLSSACRDLPALKAYLLKGWIRPQARYHRHAAHRRHRLATYSEWALILLFGLTVLAGVLHITGALHGHEDWADVLTVLPGIAFPAWATAIHGISDLLDHERISERSRNMARVLDSMALKLEEAKTMDELRNTAAEVEWIIMSENLEWVASLMFRKPPVVAV